MAKWSKAPDKELRKVALFYIKLPAMAANFQLRLEKITKTPSLWVKINGSEIIYLFQLLSSFHFFHTCSFILIISC